MEAFGAQLAMFTGHPRMGYVTLDDSHDLLLQHPGSSVSAVGSEPPKFVIYDQVVTTKFTQMMHVTGIP